MTKNQDAIKRLFKVSHDRTGNLPPLPDIFPDYVAPVVGAIHPKAMPVILRTQDKIDAWLTRPAEDVPAMQRPLPDGTLEVVAIGLREDP